MKKLRIGLSRCLPVRGTDRRPTPPSGSSAEKCFSIAERVFPAGGPGESARGGGAAAARDEHSRRRAVGDQGGACAARACRRQRQAQRRRGVGAGQADGCGGACVPTLAVPVAGGGENGAVRLHRQLVGCSRSGTSSWGVHPRSTTTLRGGGGCTLSPALCTSSYHPPCIPSSSCPPPPAAP
jgi:hypothetical protein